MKGGNGFPMLCPVVTLDALQFSDTLPAGLVISTPSVVTGTCGGGTINAPAGSNLITVDSAVLAPLASCTFSVNVSSDGTVLGLLTNTTSTVTSDCVCEAGVANRRRRSAQVRERVCS